MLKYWECSCCPQLDPVALESEAGKPQKQLRVGKKCWPEQQDS